VADPRAAVDATLAALADPVRRAVVDRLRAGPARSSELAAALRLPRSTVSKHLAVLRAHGIVESRREGTVVIYRLLTPCVVNFLSCAAQVLEERP